MNEVENRKQKIREWAVEMASILHGDKADKVDVFNTALIVEDYVLNGDKGRLVDALINPKNKDKEG